MHTIGRSPRDEVDAWLSFEHPQRHVQGQGIARAAAIAIRGDHRDFGEPQQGLAQAPQALRSEAVVVADQDLHAVRVFECIKPGAALRLEPGKGASLYCFVRWSDDQKSPAARLADGARQARLSGLTSRRLREQEA